MKRRLFTILSALSLSLFVAVVLLWVRSYWIEDHFTPRAEYLLSSRTGTATLFRFHNVEFNVPVRRHAAVRRELYTSVWRDLWETAQTRWRVAGFAYARMSFGGGEGYTLVAVPYWTVALTSALFPAVWLLRAYRSGALRLAGLCRHCGYDWRATPEAVPGVWEGDKPRAKHVTGEAFARRG